MLWGGSAAGDGYCWSSNGRYRHCTLGMHGHSFKCN
jgi:hypothetical protein